MRSMPPRGSSSSATFFPRWKIHTPRSELLLGPDQAAKTTFFHASVAEISSGVWGRVMKTRLSPRLRSYVWRERPTEVVIWKVVLPSGSAVKGTLVGDTRPTVYDWCVSCVQMACWFASTYSERREYFGLADELRRALFAVAVCFLALCDGAGGSGGLHVGACHGWKRWTRCD
jgi:hypothetical protein